MSAKFRYFSYGAVFLICATATSVYLLQNQSNDELYSAGIPGLNGPNDANDNRIVERRAQQGRFDLQLLSEDYQLDDVFMSMHGPRSNHPMIHLVDDVEADKVVWMTGLKTDVVDSESLNPVSNEFFCHSNLTLNPVTSSPEQHNESLGGLHATWRFFTLVPGKMEIRLPEGFGVPVKNGTKLDYFTMSLNQNDGLPPRQVRMKTTISGQYQTDDRPLKSLFRRALYVYQQHQLTQAEMLARIMQSDQNHGELCGEDCLTPQLGQSPSYFKVGLGTTPHPGEMCCVPNASSEGIMQRFGEHNTIHWMIPPGQHLYRSEVTEQLELPADTTAHYVTGHLHPYGTCLKLIDMDTKEVLFDIHAESFDDKLGVKQMSEVSSTEGVPLRADHRYELIAEYDNRLEKPIDAMAILYLYALEKRPATPVGQPLAAK